MTIIFGEGHMLGVFVKNKSVSHTYDENIKILFFSRLLGELLYINKNKTICMPVLSRELRPVVRLLSVTKSAIDGDVASVRFLSCWNTIKHSYLYIAKNSIAC